MFQHAKPKVQKIEKRKTAITTGQDYPRIPKLMSFGVWILCVCVKNTKQTKKESSKTLKRIRRSQFGKAKRSS